MLNKGHHVTRSPRHKVFALTAALFLIAAVALLAGCKPDNYALEREYYWLQMSAQKIFRNPHATPPNQLENVVKKFNDFTARNAESALAVESQFTIARLYLIKNEHENARAQLKKIINTYSKNPNICSEAVFLIGNTYEMQNKWDSALIQYKKIMQDYPTTLRGVDIPIYIIQHYKIKLQPDRMMEATRQAIEHYKAMAAKYPGSPFAYRVEILIAQCYTLLKEWNNSISTFRSIIDKYKDKVSMDGVMMDMAMIYSRELKDNDNALKVLEQLLADYPKSRLSNAAKAMMGKLKEQKE